MSPATSNTKLSTCPCPCTGMCGAAAGASGMIVPSTLPDLMFWLRGDMLAFNGASNGPAAVNASVGTWGDAANNGIDVTAAAGNPTLKAVGSQRGIDFGGLTYATSPAFTAQSVGTVFILLKMGSTLASQTVIGGTPSINTQTVYVSSTGKWSIYNGSAQLISAVSPTTNVAMLTAQFNGASSFLRLDGTQIASGNPGTSALTALSVGANMDGTSKMNGTIFHVIRFNRALTADEITGVEAYLTHWLTIPHPPVDQAFWYPGDCLKLTNNGTQIPIVQGQPICEWGDASCYSRTLLQNTAGKQPQESPLALNRYSAVNFAADANQVLECATSFTSVTGWTLYAVCKAPNGTGVVGAVLAIQSTGFQVFQLRNFVGFVLMIGCSAGPVYDDATQFGSYGIWKAEFDDSNNLSSYITPGGTLRSAPDGGTWPNGSATIRTGNFNFGAQVVELICYQTPLNGTDEAAVLAYLQAKYNL